MHVCDPTWVIALGLGEMRTYLCWHGDDRMRYITNVFTFPQTAPSKNLHDVTLSLNGDLFTASASALHDVHDFHAGIMKSTGQGMHGGCGLGLGVFGQFVSAELWVYCSGCGLMKVYVGSLDCLRPWRKAGGQVTGHSQHGTNRLSLSAQLAAKVEHLKKCFDQFADSSNSLDYTGFKKVSPQHVLLLRPIIGLYYASLHGRHGEAKGKHGIYMKQTMAHATFDVQSSKKYRGRYLKRLGDWGLQTLRALHWEFPCQACQRSTSRVKLVFNRHLCLKHAFLPSKRGRVSSTTANIDNWPEVGQIAGQITHAWKVNKANWTGNQCWFWRGSTSDSSGVGAAGQGNVFACRQGPTPGMLIPLSVLLPNLGIKEAGVFVPKCCCLLCSLS